MIVWLLWLLFVDDDDAIERDDKDDSDMEDLEEILIDEYEKKDADKESPAARINVRTHTL